MIDIVGKILYPDVCVFCKKYSESTVCSSCYNRIIVSSGEKSAFSSLFNLGDTFCYGKYIGILKDSFIEYKFYGNQWMGKRFA